MFYSNFILRERVDFVNSTGGLDGRLWDAVYIEIRFFRESQNHRLAGVVRDLKRSLSPNPLVKQVPYNSDTDRYPDGS